MKKFYSFSLALILLFTATNSQATHYLGGEMSYRYLGDNNYEIIVRLYRDCDHGDAKAIEQDLPVTISIFNGTDRYLSDSLNTYTTGSLHPAALPECYQDTNDHICVSWAELRKVYKLPLSNKPYTFVNQRCCMTPEGSNILQPELNGLTLYTVIPDAKVAPFGNSGPAFRSMPPARVCVNDHFSLDFGSTDPEGDSLYYHFETGYNGGTATNAKPTPITTSWTALDYLPGYSFLNPLGSNGKMDLDSKTGMLSGYCSAPGEYLVCVVCESYKMGTWIGRNSRQYVLTVDDCGKTIRAAVKVDSMASLIGNGTGIAVCDGTTKISFKNLSVNAREYHWDFGVSAQADDTSSEFEPSFTYPTTGLYPLTLIAKNSDCADTFRTMVRIANEAVSADFMISGGPCQLETLTLTDNSMSTGSAIRNSYWEVGSTIMFGGPVQFKLLQSGSFDIMHVVVTDSGCVGTISKPFTTVKGAINAGNDTTVIKSAALVLEATGGVSYNWSEVSPATFTKYRPTSAIQTPNTGVTGKNFMFIVSGTDASGCGAIDTVLVTVSEQGYCFVPNAFTPNGDGRNDVLRAYISGQTFISFAVYSQHGKEMFQSGNLQFGWDGRYNGAEAPAASYYWVVRTKDDQGNEQVSKGEVMLVR